MSNSVCLLALDGTGEWRDEAHNTHRVEGDVDARVKQRLDAGDGVARLQHVVDGANDGHTRGNARLIRVGSEPQTVIHNLLQSMNSSSK